MIGSFADSPDYPRVPARVLEREWQYTVSRRRGIAYLLRVPILLFRNGLMAV